MVKPVAEKGGEVQAWKQRESRVTKSLPQTAERRGYALPIWVWSTSLQEVRSLRVVPLLGNCPGGGGRGSEGACGPHTRVDTGGGGVSHSRVTRYEPYEPKNALSLPGGPSVAQWDPQMVDSSRVAMTSHAT